MFLKAAGELKKISRNANHSLTGLDGLRGIAILLVMLFHLIDGKPVARIDVIFFQLKDYGWSGVDLFFVLAGFLITGILVDSKGENNYFKNFYARRALSILPLYYAFFLGLLILYPIFGGERVAAESSILKSNQWWVWTHMVNWLVAIKGDFWIATPLGVGGFWSISIEEQFYLIWPFIVLFMSDKRLLRFSMGLVVAAVLIRFAMAAMHVAWATIYTTLFARMDAIAIGAIIAVIARSSSGLSRIKRIAPVIVISTLLGLAVLHRFNHSSYKLSDQFTLAIQCTLFVWLWGSVLTCTLTAKKGSIVQTLTDARILKVFGKFSFGLYLFHGHLPRLFAKFGFHSNSRVIIGGSFLIWQLLFLTISILTSLLIAYLSWHLYEKHFLKLKGYFSGQFQTKHS